MPGLAILHGEGRASAPERTRPILLSAANAHIPQMAKDGRK
jgi:hypothetical protein